MIARKILVTACAAALTTSPAWAMPPENPGAQGRSHAEQHARPPLRGHGRSHRCAPHAVAYVASGRLVSHTLVLDADARADRPSASGDVTIAVASANRHARADKGTTKTYTLDHARLLGLEDLNSDGRVDLGDVAPDSRVKVIGSVTKLAKRCDQSGFTPQLRIGKLVVNAPPAA
jgi:hypothetical protein